jgi:O-antigen/teichoic acid export membrane protein
MKKSSFIEGTLIATFAIVFTKMLGMFYVIPFYAMVGIQGSALYAYAYNIYVIFLDISSAGLPIAVSKLINEYNTLGMMDAKVRTYKICKRIMIFLAVVIFLILFIFAPVIAEILLGDLSGGNTIEDVALAIRSVSFAILVVPFLSVTKGYLQGHKIINVSSFSQVIEQIVRITIILVGGYLILKVFNGSVRTAVCLAVFAAFIGGVVAYVYVRLKISRDKLLRLDKEHKKDEITDKEITKKLFSYAIPFIIINVIGSLYNFIDMTLVLRTMNYIGLDAQDVEFITSSISTWAPKINMIITSLAMGMSTSLIPTMVTSWTAGDKADVNNKFNQALQLIIFVSVPMALGIMLLSEPIWGIFYGVNKIGSRILSLYVVAGLLLNVYMTTESALQGLNKFKLVYTTTIIGLGLKILLDVPFMLLLNKLNFYPYLGSIFATIVGYTVSILYSLTKLKKECNMKFMKTKTIALKVLVPTTAMVIVVLISMYFIPYVLGNRLSSVLYVAINALIGAVVYGGISIAMKIPYAILGKGNVNNYIKKITSIKLFN